MNPVLHSSEKVDWRTPAAVLLRVERVAPIGLDPCMGEIVNGVWTLTEDGLSRSWEGHGLVFCNPPYGRMLGRWIAKAHRASVGEFAPFHGAEIIMLIPARPDTKAWHDHIFGVATRICFWKGRIKFEGYVGGPAPFPSAVIYYGERPERFERAFEDHGRVLRP